jgi:hypothetical protein
MAKSKNNLVTHGLSGKLGGTLVFRQVNGETIVTQMPARNAKLTEKQEAVRKNFQQATIYATGAVRDPVTGELYAAAAKKTKGLSAYNVAVADFLHAPSIKTIDLSKYTGVAGDEIHIVASDDFAVQSVHVSISNHDASLGEEGYATQAACKLWVYVTSQDNNYAEGTRIVVSASDIPGNVTSETREL